MNKLKSNFLIAIGSIALLFRLLAPMAGRVEIPLVLWNGPPPHSVTCMSLALDDTRLLTGSASGHICLWRLSLPDRSRSSSSTSSPAADPASGMEPWALLMGHASTVVDIGVGLYQGTEEVAISLSDDGTLCLWAPRDGRCLAKCPNLIRGIASPRAITVFRRSHYAAITGHDTGIEIINLWTLQSMRTMNAHQGEWVCATARSTLTVVKEAGRDGGGGSGSDGGGGGGGGGVGGGGWDAASGNDGEVVLLSISNGGTSIDEGGDAGREDEGGDGAGRGTVTCTKWA